MAVPAKPGVWRTISLTDGTQVKVQLVGDEFMHYYNEADLIISKGQGNYEGLMNENNSRIFHLLMVKCDVIAELLNVNKGSFVVYNKANTIYKN